MDESGSWNAAEEMPADGHPTNRRADAATENWTSSGGLNTAGPDGGTQDRIGWERGSPQRGSPERTVSPRNVPGVPAQHFEDSGTFETPWTTGNQADDRSGGAKPKSNEVGSTPPRDSWGVAWERTDPRVNASAIVDVQPTWSDRPATAKLLAKQEPGRTQIEHPPTDASGPAWLYPKPQTPRFVDSLVDSGVRRRAQLAAQSLRVGSTQSSTQSARETAPQPRAVAAENTLKQSREQVASRWFALKGVFAKTEREQTPEKQGSRERKRNTPFVVVYSLAGGVGKTSLVATLGRALSSLGEKVLLTDTTSQGLLPFYFGANELQAGVVRMFSPPAGSSDAPIQLVSYDFAAREKDPAKSESETHGEVFDDLLANSHRANRVLMDLNVNCGWMVGRMAWMKPTILVPLSPDMNSVLSLHSVERSFSGMKDADGNALQPVYLLNQFDASLPLHLEVREVLKQQLGDRLLPFVIRRASSVSEALAEGMTIVDYDPESEVARDYMGVASWLRNASAPATVGFRNLRWSER